MLIALIMQPLFTLIFFLITLLPELGFTPPSFSALFSIIGYGTYILGANYFAFVIGNIVFWLTVQLGWAIVEWIYKKVPGIK